MHLTPLTMPRLQVLAGESPTSLVKITDIVNTDKPYIISTKRFDGQVVVNIKGLTNPQGEVLDSEYFHRSDRQGITWSIQIQGMSLITRSRAICLFFKFDLTIVVGRFLQPLSSDDILFGNIFDRPLQLPWGSSAVFRFMRSVLMTHMYRRISRS